MLKIYYTLNSIFRRYYFNKPELFKDGFRKCLELLDEGLTKHPQFNAHIECDRLGKEVSSLQKQLRQKEIEIEKLKRKVNEKTIYAQAPTQWYKLFQVELEGLSRGFYVITNMHTETFKNMCINFAGRYSWTDEIECKAMMLQYINSKSSLGFKAYKDEKTALKDNVKIRR